MLSKVFKLFSCKEYSMLCSKDRDVQLSPYERFAKYFHHFICFTCRRFSKHLDIIDGACKKLECDCEGPDMSSEAHSRISDALRGKTE